MTRGLAAMRDTGFRWFFLSRAITMIAGSMSSIALAFAVLGIDNASESLAIVLTVFTLSNVVFLIFGGVVADRLPRALVIQSCYVIDILSIGTTAALLFSGTATIPLLAALSAVNGAASAFVMPAMQGIIPQLTTPEHLQQANAMLSFVRSATTIGGPIIAGALVASAGPAWVMVIQAGAWIVAIVLLALVKLPAPDPSRSSFFRDLRTGWHEFWSRTWMWSICLAFMVMNAIHIGAWGVAGPFIAKNDPRLGITGWGWVLSAEGAGILLMTLVMMWLPLRRPLRWGMLAVSALAIPLAVMGLYPQALIVAIAAFVAGAGVEVFNTGWNVTEMEQIPGDKLSRVASYDMLASFVAMPLGTLAFGWLIGHVDVSSLLIGSAIVYAAIALGTMLVPSVWRMGRIEGALTS
ncbi:MAG: MFS transporter [Microbacterium sp.]|uniref:MFS transporter n=1 Tax=Microbacterium sp. TaxID=51671 RepID=UPI001DE17D38|nr:MFS transporter [Microbacterium sp.]MBW8764210.1 MFS transporter [Microbacterium sp.]